MASRPYWINVDRPTKTARLHEASCRYVQERTQGAAVRVKGLPKLRADGEWLGFESIEAAEAYGQQLKTERLSRCGVCKP